MATLFGRRNYLDHQPPHQRHPQSNARNTKNSGTENITQQPLLIQEATALKAQEVSLTKLHQLIITFWSNLTKFNIIIRSGIFYYLNLQAVHYGQTFYFTAAGFYRFQHSIFN